MEMKETTVTYDGSVTPGGPAAVRQLDDLTISKLSVGPMDNNAYLLRCRADGTQVLIDAANDADRLLELIGAGGLATIVTTHQHGDHWQALTAVRKETGARSVAHPDDEDGIPVVDDLVRDGDRIAVGTCELEVIHLVGHTPGSIALLFRDPGGVGHLFTGDSLFPGGPGRTIVPEQFQSLMGDLETKIFGALPDETWFYPGHGADSTLGKERPALPEWRARGW
jgi:glyoxylase-like metal-dependent hydrolase (beta-lactamase superfamily II)